MIVNKKKIGEKIQLNCDYNFLKVLLDFGYIIIFKDVFNVVQNCIIYFGMERLYFK